MNLEQILEILQYYLIRVERDIEVPPEQYSNLLNIANVKQFKKKIGLPEEYRPGMPLPKEVVGYTRLNEQDLLPFKEIMGDETNPPLMVNSYGKSDIPSDLYYPLSMYYKYIYNGYNIPRPVDIVDDKKWDERLGHPIEYPTKRNPIANITSDEIRFSPKDIQYVNFVYYRLPKKPVFGYDIDKGYPKYNADKSVELEWNYVNVIDIIYIMLFELGIDVGKGDIIQVADKVKKEGM